MVRPARAFSSPSSISSKSFSSSNNNSNGNKNKMKISRNETNLRNTGDHNDGDGGNLNDGNEANQKWDRDITASAGLNLTKVKRTNDLDNRRCCIASPKNDTTIPTRCLSSMTEHSENYSKNEGLTEASSKPSAVWYQSQYQMSQMTDTKHVINAVCSNYLFARVKFVNKRKDLIYSTDPNSICQHVISQCHLAPFVNQKDWWIENAKHVMTTLTSLRSNRATALRLAFFGKCFVLWFRKSVFNDDLLKTVN